MWRTTVKDAQAFSWREGNFEQSKPHTLSTERRPAYMTQTLDLNLYFVLYIAQFFLSFSIPICFFTIIRWIAGWIHLSQIFQGKAFHCPARERLCCLRPSPRSQRKGKGKPAAQILTHATCWKIQPRGIRMSPGWTDTRRAHRSVSIKFNLVLFIYVTGTIV